MVVAWNPLVTCWPARFLGSDSSLIYMASQALSQYLKHKERWGV